MILSIMFSCFCQRIFMGQKKQQLTLHKQENVTHVESFQSYNVHVHHYKRTRHLMWIIHLLSTVFSQPS